MSAKQAEFSCKALDLIKNNGNGDKIALKELKKLVPVLKKLCNEYIFESEVIPKQETACQHELSFAPDRIHGTNHRRTKKIAGKENINITRGGGVPNP